MHPGSIPGEASIRCTAIDVARCVGSIDRQHTATGRHTMNIDFTGQRVKMVDGQVRTTDVTNLAIISAMLEVPREEFVPEKVRSLAYIDEDILLSPPHGGKGGRYLMESSPFAKLVQLAEISSDDTVLDIGCASGYSSAVLSRLCQQVVALEADSSLANLAAANLKRLGYDNVKVVEGPLESGHPAKAGYDVIFVGGSVQQIPQVILDQLKDGGRLVTVIGQGNAGVARLYTKSGTSTAGRYAFNAAIKPLPGFELAQEFEF